MAGVKGKSGRKPNEHVFRFALTERLDEIDPVSGRKKLFSIAEKLVDMALGGDMQAIKELMDRVDGKPAQSLVHSNDPDNPLTHDPNQLTDAQLAAIAAAGGFGAPEAQKGKSKPH